MSSTSQCSDIPPQSWPSPRRDQTPGIQIRQDPETGQQRNLKISSGQNTVYLPVVEVSVSFRVDFEDSSAALCDCLDRRS